MDLSCKNECVLTPSEFEEICKLSKDGRTEELSRFVSKILGSRNCRVGAKTFCPDPRLRQPAPFVLAAQYGRKDVVEYFLKYFGGIFDINHSATIVSLTTNKKVHCVAALWATCTGGHLEIVKVLITHGANVNQLTLTRSTPFRGAAFHGNIEIMEVLLSNGAEIDTPNMLGQSPLCTAAMRGHLEALKYLISKGANLHQKTTHGYSILHLSAAKGKVEIVKYLLSIGMSPMFLEANPLDEEYVPCPLFLAASAGQKGVVDELILQPNCPLSCQVDALLLLGASKFQIRGFTAESRDMWIKALTLKEKYKTPLLPPIDSYGNRIEMRSLEAFHRLSSIPNEAYFQSLIIRERCMGYGDQGLIYFLVRRGRWFCKRGDYREAELLWYRAMDMEVKACEVEIRLSKYAPSEPLQKDLEQDLAQYSNGIWKMVQAGYMPNFARYLEFGLKALEISELMQTKSEDGWIIDLQVLLGIMLFIFTSRLHYTSDDTGSVRRSEQCEELGSRFVTKYLYAVSGSTLLHHALTCFTALQSDGVIDEEPTNLIPLIRAILRWGANKVIGIPNCEGKRPIVIAIEIKQTDRYDDTDTLISLLVSGGKDDTDGSG